MIGWPEMSTSQSWVVCEHSSRWGAALRVAIARLPRAQFAPRLYEVRSLADLTAHLNEHRHGLGLIEVRRANLAEVLALLADGRSRQLFALVALLDQSPHPRCPHLPNSHDADQRPVIDALWEAGAAEVVESPRNLDRLLALGERLTTAASRQVGFSSERQMIADWARSALPWRSV